LSEGKKLSTDRHDSNLPPGIARERALAEAEKRRKLGLLMGPAGGNKLGGSSASKNAGKSLRQILAEAADRRQRDDKQCAHGETHDAEAEAIKAEKDSLTLIDLTSSDSEEDQVEPKSGLVNTLTKAPLFRPEDHDTDPQSSDSDIEIISSTSKPIASTSKVVASRPKGSQTQNSSAKDSSKPIASSSKVSPAKAMKRKPSRSPLPARKRLQPVDTLSTEWACSACTYVNPASFLQCHLCQTIKPTVDQDVSKIVVSGPRATDNLKTVDKWFCHVCAEENPHERWSCHSCSNIKLSS